MTENFELTAPDGKTIPAYSWTPDAAPTAVVQILHGMGEYAKRYDRLAIELVDAGFAVVAHDFRGHGEDAEVRGHYDDRDGWSKCVDDCLAVHKHAKTRFEGLPIILLGHSMGSFFAQHVAMQAGLAGMILSASNWPNKLSIYPGLLAAKLESLRLGRRGHSPTLDKMGFGSFNKRFEPARTEYDWLSRDDAEVDKYINDPLCGGKFTTAFWLDVLGGLRRISSDSALGHIPVDLPILITGGGDDPVGGDKGLGNLMLHYAQTSHQRLSIKIYDGGRHEMLFETNRDEFVGNLLDWIHQVAARHKS